MLSALSFVSCLEMEDPQSDAVGYLSAPELEVDVTVDDLTPTKGAIPEIVAPSESDILFTVKDKDGKTCYSGEGLWTEPLTLPVGAYTVEAVYGSNTFGSAYFAGSASGTISALDAEEPALSLSLANALVKVSVSQEFASHFTGSKVVMNDGAYEASFDEWFFVPSGSDIAMTLVGTNSAGTPKEYSYTLPAPAAKTAYSVACSQSSTNWPEISWSAETLAGGAFEGGLYFSPVSVSNMSDDNAAKMVYQIKGGSYSDWTDVEVADVQGYKYISGLSNGETYSLRSRVGNIVSEELPFSPVSFQSCLSGSVTAAHNNAGNENVELSSTTMTVEGMKVNLPAIIAEMASVTASGSFSSSNNAATGSFSGAALSSSAKNVSFTNASGWPYLPQGNYSATISAVCSLNGAEYTASSTASVTVPAPVFSLTMTSYTSYDKYAGTNNITKDVNGDNGANKCDAATLYNAGGQWGIATSLMTNTNYAKTLVIDIDGNTDRTFNVESFDGNSYYENISGLSWASHGLAVSVTFDGVTIKKEQTHHITGLPHRATPPTNSGDHSWNDLEGNNTWKNDCVQLYYSSGKYPRISSPSFNIFSDVNVTVETKIYREYYWTPVAKGDVRISRYNNSSGSESTIHQDELAREKTLETSWETTMTSTYNAYYIQHRYMADTGKVNVYYFNVLYR